jgi:hypothetical protein
MLRSQLVEVTAMFYRSCLPPPISPIEIAASRRPTLASAADRYPIDNQTDSFIVPVWTYKLVRPMFSALSSMPMRRFKNLCSLSIR